MPANASAARDTAAFLMFGGRNLSESENQFQEAPLNREPGDLHESVRGRWLRCELAGQLGEGCITRERDAGARIIGEDRIEESSGVVRELGVACLVARDACIGGAH